MANIIQKLLYFFSAVAPVCKIDILSNLDYLKCMNNASGDIDKEYFDKMIDY